MEEKKEKREPLVFIFQPEKLKSDSNINHWQTGPFKPVLLRSSNGLYSSDEN